MLFLTALIAFAKANIGIIFDGDGANKSLHQNINKGFSCFLPIFPMKHFLFSFLVKGMKFVETHGCEDF